MELRSLGPEEASIAARAIRELKPAEELRGNATEELLTAFLEGPSTILVVASDGDAPLGYAVAYELPRADGGSPMIHLYEVQVGDAHRRRRVGSGLVEGVTAEGIRRGAGSMWVLTDDGNRPAMGLYASCGARRTVPDQILFAWRLAGEANA
ncbi:MAG: GNAT family N-acetyltransferase [Candidatus Bipolaricaulota bacterium]|nr:MAG: GNAT family N-acetyltransferase [Candidatus Bipolaricaulota bacterium]